MTALMMAAISYSPDRHGKELPMFRRPTVPRPGVNPLATIAGQLLLISVALRLALWLIEPVIPVLIVLFLMLVIFGFLFR